MTVYILIFFSKVHGVEWNKGIIEGVFSKIEDARQYANNRLQQEIQFKGCDAEDGCYLYSDVPIKYPNGAGYAIEINIISQVVDVELERVRNDS